MSEDHGVDAALVDRMVAFRRDLHQHPELSWAEERTTRRIEAALDNLGIRHRRLLGTGVIADLPGPDNVQIVALRADIDALPIQEETGYEFASERAGVMHACGHDGHTSILLGAAELLRANSELPAPVRLIFQPAEEVGAGARRLIEAGVLDGVGMIFGGHLDRYFSTGTLTVSDGPVSAYTDAFRIGISGKGGHAARPHESVDAVVVGSLMVMSIQTIVSREVNPAHPAVVSVGRFNAGTIGNAIAGHAVLEGTIRTRDAGVREHFRQAVRRIAGSVGMVHGAGVEVEFHAGSPIVRNPPEVAQLARTAAARVVPKDSIAELTTVNMGGEDFGYYLEQIPGCYIRFGARVEGQAMFPAHSSRFDFDEQAMAYGAAWFVEAAKVGGEAIR